MKIRKFRIFKLQGMLMRSEKSGPYSRLSRMRIHFFRVTFELLKPRQFIVEKNQLPRLSNYNSPNYNSPNHVQEQSRYSEAKSGLPVHEPFVSRILQELYRGTTGRPSQEHATKIRRDLMLATNHPIGTPTRSLVTIFEALLPYITDHVGS